MGPFTYENNPLFKISPEYIVSFRESRSARSVWWYCGEDTITTARKKDARKFPDRKSAEQFVKEVKTQSHGLIFCVEEVAT